MMSVQILLVDDDMDLLESYEESLEIAGYDVITADTGKKGFELYKKNQPCIVFSDIKMPEMDGYELFSRIHEFDYNAKVVLVTGHEDKEKSIIAKNNGLIDVMEKPMKNNALEIVAKKNGC